MKADQLVKGRFYQDTEGIHGNGLPLEFVGVEVYNEQPRYHFWDRRARLGHWLEPERVQEVSLWDVAVEQEQRIKELAALLRYTLRYPDDVVLKEEIAALLATKYQRYRF